MSKQAVNKTPQQRYRTSWKRGEWFDDRHCRILKAAPSGYRYVHSGNDTVMVSVTSGIIGAIFGNMIS